MQKLESHLDNLSSYNCESFVFLDANINLLCEPTNFSENYIETIHTSGFVQCIQKATRIQNKSRSLIDHILTNCSSNLLTSGSFICDISDHFLIFIQLPYKSKAQAAKKVESRNFTDANIAKFKDSLKTRVGQMC